MTLTDNMIMIDKHVYLLEYMTLRRNIMQMEKMHMLCEKTCNLRRAMQAAVRKHNFNKYYLCLMRQL